MNKLSKYTRQLISKQEKETAIQNRKNFEKMLPRKGSYLRQLVDIQLANLTNK